MQKLGQISAQVDKFGMKFPTGPIRLLFELLLVVAASEMVVMLAMPVLIPGLGPWAEGLLDVSLLLLLAAPLVYWRAMVYTRNWGTTGRSVNHGRAQGSLSFSKAVVLTASAQVAGLLLTAAGVFYLQQILQREGQFQFDSGVKRIESEIARRLNQTLYGLAGLRGSFAANSASSGSAQLDRKAFKAYVDSRNLSAEFPGIRGFGFIERVERSKLSDFVDRVRKDGAPDFTVRTSGSAEQLYVIKNIEPLQNNRAALGFDVGQEPVRREAAERAVSSGDGALTGRIVLVQDQKKTPGFLFFLPVYKEGLSPLLTDLRPASLTGLVYTPIVASELFMTTRTVTQSMLDFSLFDGNSLGTEQLVFEDSLAVHSEGKSGTPFESRFQTLVPLRVGGRLLSLRVKSTPEFEAMQNRSSVALAGVGGVFASFMMALTVWLLAAGRLRAQNMAARMTQDLDRLARVVKHTQSAVAISDAAGRVSWINDGFAKLTGWEPVEVYGKPALSMIHIEKTPASVMDQLKEASAQGEEWRGEVVLLGKESQDHWVHLELQPILDTDGKFAGYMEIGTDVTQQKLEHQKLQTAIRSVSTLLSTFEVHAIVSITDRDGVIFDLNEAFCTVSGYTREELLGQNHRIVNSGTHPDTFWVEMWNHISSGKSWRGDVCNRAKDGSLYWVDSIITPFIGDDGFVERYVSVRTDITARKTAELRLIEVTDRMTLAIDGGSDGLWDWIDIEKDAQWWSPNYYAILGYTPDELAATATSYLSLLHPDFHDISREAGRAAIEDGKQFDIEVQMRTKLHGYRWFRTRAKVHFDLQGKACRMSGATQDIHDRKLAQQELQKINARFSIAAESAGIGVWEWDLKTQTLTWDSQMYRLFGQSESAKSPALTILMQSLHTADKDRFESALRATIISKHPFEGDYRIVWPNEEVRHIRAGARSVMGPDNKVNQLVGVNFDITAIKMAQESLIASEAFLDRAGRIAGVGGWRVDLVKQKITWSKVTRSIHEVSDDYEPQLDQAINFYAPEARPVIENAVNQGISIGTPWDLELPLITAKGRRIWVRAVGEVEFADGKPVALVGAFQDISERRLREAELLLLEACIERINDSILITKANVLDGEGPEIVFTNLAFEKSLS